MKAPIRLLIPALAATLAACATLMPDRPPEQNAQLRLDRGLDALEAGLFSEAFDDLAWVYSHCSSRQAGVQALTAMAAMELDPRNPAARPALGAELLGQLVQDPGTPAWVRPLSETTFLAALALGAPHPGDEGAAGDEHAHDHGADVVMETPVDHEGMEHPALADTAAATGLVFGCGPEVEVEGWDPPTLPTLSGPSMAELLANAHQRRDAATAQADTLQKELAAVKEQLAATREELDRIRETLKP